jgi:hypothetical protein
LLLDEEQMPTGPVIPFPQTAEELEEWRRRAKEARKRKR